MKRRRFASLLRLFAPLAIVLFAASLGFAEEYEPVTELAQPRRDSVPYVVGAYLFIWAAMGVYGFTLSAGYKRARAQLDLLRRRVG